MTVPNRVRSPATNSGSAVELSTKTETRRHAVGRKQRDRDIDAASDIRCL